MLNLRYSRTEPFVHWKTFIKPARLSGVFALAGMLGLLLAQTSLYASGPVTSVFTTTTVATPFTYIGTDGNTYNWGQGDDLRITGFQFNVSNFVLESPASQVIIRRVDNPRASGEPCGIFVEKTATYAFPGNINYEATSPDDGAGNCELESVIAGDIINRGALDVFDNFTGTKAKNIERIDFIFPDGLIPPSDPLLLAETGHVVTEKSGNNPVKIAAILSLDGAGNPASYGNLIRVDKASDPNVDVAYGFPGLGAGFDFLINNQTPPHQTLIKNGESFEGLGIAFVTLDDLGVGAGVKYFGFSYFGADIDDTVHTLIDVATFPTNTAEADVNDGDADIYGGTAGYFVNQVLINQQPDAVDDTATTPVNTGINIDVLANDSDPDAGDELTLSIISQPPNGTVTLNDGGTPADPTDDTIDYLPNVDFAGEDSFDYQVSDGATGSSTTDIATVTVTVQGPPDAVDDTALTDVDSPVNIDVLDNDTDANNDDLNISAIADPVNGTAVINDGGTPADGTDDTIDYTPDTGFVGDDSFTYDVSDGQGGVSTATVTVIVNAVPTATDDVVVTLIDTVVVIDVVDNDSDQNNDPLIITVTVPPSNGAAIVNDGGTPADPTDDTIEYTPNAGFEGTDTFTYQIDDGNGGVDTATVTVTVSDDADGDGISDAIDLDDDNDGIPDSVEGTDDFDGDGIANNLDLDSDGDGILDLAESGLSDAEIATLDTDADGVIDSTQNFGANGLADGVETAADSGEVDYDNDGAADDPVDTDGDTNPDFLDLDSDNDGVTDVIEAGLNDADADGEADAGQTPILVAPDTDGDGIKDIHDLDSDNDGVTDSNEAGLVDADGDGRIDGFTDADGDGYDDATAATPAALPDTDGDGINDIHDLDSDNDGVTDTAEAGLTDSNGDGIVDGFTDADGDGYDDATAAAPAALPDTDSDGVRDIHDLDSDNDGVTDTTEAGLSDADGDGRIDGFTDADGDGYDDNTSASPVPPTDTDTDGVPDMLELDSDGDGITDASEAGIPDADNDGIVDDFVDTNGDGLIDNLPPITTDDVVTTPVDTEVVINVIANDSDPNNDPLLITVTVPPGNGAAVVNDGGTLADLFDDRIVYTPNAGFEGIDAFTYQVDDGNGGVATATVTVTVSDDADGDGISDAIDLDDDNDSIPDSVEGTDDFDGDGIANNLDLDSDGDGILDLAESGLSDAEIAALDTDADGVIDSTQNFGANGLADGVETAADSGEVDYDNDGAADDPVDTDGDTNPDFLDLDSDNDGITDVIEAGLNDADGDGEADAGQTPILAAPDTDGDGVKDIHDLDSDNDGVTDTAEAGLTDSNGDGIVDGFTDADGDGYDDATAAAPAALPDTDGDGVNDIHDLDSDNDGVTDTTEAGLADADGDGRIDGFTDANADGYDDNTSASPVPPTDTDNDGVPDMLELDSDGDGVTDAIEAGIPDADNDGIVDGFVDINGDGLSDNLVGGTVCSDCNLITGTKGGSFGMNLLLLMIGVLTVRKFLRRKSGAFVPAGKTLALSGVIAILPLTVQADPSPGIRDFNQRFYLGGSIGLSKLEPDASCPCFGVDDDSDQGFKIHLGYDLTRRLTLEGYYADLGEAGIKNNSDGSHAGEIDYQTYGVSLLAYLFNHRKHHESDTTKYDDEGLYRREGLSLFGRAGVGGMENSSDLPFERDNDVHFALGGGLEYGWRNGLATRLEYVAYDEDAHMLTLGLIKRFGSKESKSTRAVAATPEPVAVVEEKPLPIVPAPVVVAADSDADGVVDTVDQCPDSVAGAVVDAKGCEKKPEFTGVLEGVNFETASAVLTVQAKTILDRVVGQLKQSPEFKLLLVGHTDNVGDPEKNKALSLERAKSVASYLQSAGISSARMKYNGVGDTQPRTSNDNRAGRAQNRRVELLPQ